MALKIKNNNVPPKGGTILENMCLSPITILNPNKYISLNYRDRFLLQVPCGQCAECQSQNSNSWQFRTYHEFVECLSSGRNHFVMFDTLTYSDEHLPHMSDIVSDLPNIPCFNHKHITNFLKKFRINLSRKYNVNKIRYFVSSEYGELHHRPHYHLLLFIYADIDPLIVSRMISDNWQYGRTDGIPYQPSAYVYEHNVVRSGEYSNVLRTCNYVTKYVQKNCKFQTILNARLSVAMHQIGSKIAPDDLENWLQSYNASLLKRKLKAHINQFHRQSLHFGESFLAECDLNELFNNGVVYLPSSRCLKMPVALPMYYKRKLFYEPIKVNGAMSWQLTDLGKEYLTTRSTPLLDNLIHRFEAVIKEFDLNYSPTQLAEYVLNIRGRIDADNPESTISERLPSVSLFAYLTASDKHHVGLGISPQYIGNTTRGFKASHLPAHYTPSQFISNHVMLDEILEKQLNHIYSCLSRVRKSKQAAFELGQRLDNIYKLFQ